MVHVPDHIENPDAWLAARAARIKFNRFKTGRRQFEEQHPDLAAALIGPPEPDVAWEDMTEAQAEDYRRLVSDWWKRRESYRIPDFIFDALEEWGGLTEKQVALVRAKIEKRDELQAGWDADEAARRERAPDWTAGRHEVTGTVKTTKRVERPPVAYGDSGVSWKMLVELEDGRLLWTTIPRAIEGTKVEVKGRTFTLRVTVEPKKEDATFGWGKRPHLVEEVK
jgi:hypothetical protein